MKIVLAADGSKFTTKALAFLLAQAWVHEREIIAVNVQLRLTSRSLAQRELAAHYKAEAEAVLKPVERLLKRHRIAYRCVWMVGYPAEEIVKLAKKEKAQMIVMGTRGRSAIGSVFMGSVAQGVVSLSTVPVLLVK
jgi:nucleotide-binding universal stress UspA family protein